MTSTLRFLTRCSKSSAEDEAAATRVELERRPGYESAVVHAENQRTEKTRILVVKGAVDEDVLAVLPRHGYREFCADRDGPFRLDAAGFDEIERRALRAVEGLIRPVLADARVVRPEGDQTRGHPITPSRTAAASPRFSTASSHSIERKHQNISAILNEAHFPWIVGWP